MACGPRPPQGHRLAADQQLPSQDSQHARRGREHTLHWPQASCIPPPGRGGCRWGVEGTPAAALPCAQLRPLHRLRGRARLQAPLLPPPPAPPGVTPSGSPLFSAPALGHPDGWLLLEWGTVPELTPRLALGTRREGLEAGTSTAAPFCSWGLLMVPQGSRWAGQVRRAGRRPSWAAGAVGTVPAFRPAAQARPGFRGERAGGTPCGSGCG